MKIIYNRIFLEHDTGIHPENKERLLCFQNLQETDIPSGEKYLSLYHTNEYIEQVKSASITKSNPDPETPISQKSYEAACIAVGACILASERKDFALVRPPGHHAYPDHFSGFCLFNNIAIASQKLVNEGKKVLIIDIDGHLGDGTEYFFYTSDKVMYLSLHQYPAFPMKGREDEIGEGNGRGFTINIPLPEGTGDDIYINALEKFIPVCIQFKPDIVGISAGFDAYHKDPLLHLRLTLGSYYQIGKILSKNFPNIFAVLEGGYDVQTMPKCVHNFIAGINNETQVFDEPKTDSSILVLEEYETRINNLEKILKNYWKI